MLVILIAVFLSYNANTGLPFVPTRELQVDVVNGSNLTVGNDVREGGYRIGLVSGLAPIELPSGLVGAQLTLQLTRRYGSVPVDSTVSIRPLSVLGSKYVDLRKGRSPEVIDDGGTLPVSQTHVPVQVDEIFQTFDPLTRRAIQGNLVGIGNTLAGRGSALNDTISTLPELLRHLEPVAANLSAPSTRLTFLIRSLNVFMGTVAPVAPVAARLFTDMATTFEAISRDPNALATSIAETPSTLAVGTDSLAVQQPFLANLTVLGNKLAPATSALEATLPVLNPAIEAGIKTLPQTPVLERKPATPAERRPAAGVGAGDQPVADWADIDRRHAQPDAPLPGAVPDRLQRLELLVDVPRRPPVRADRVRIRATRAAQSRVPLGRQRRPAGRHDSGQRHRRQRPAAADGLRWPAVPPRPVIRRRGRYARQRRLRDRAAWVPEEAQPVRPRATKPRAGRAHAR